VAYKIKKLEWSITKGFLGERLHTRALGMDWTIPLSNGTAQDNKRVEAEKDKAQNEFERAMQRWIEDSDVATDDKPVRNSLMAQAALKTLVGMSYHYDGGDVWKPPLGGRPPILSVDDKGVATVVTPTAKDRVIDHLIQEHAEVSKWYKAAAERGQVGLTPGLRERLKSVESALAIAVKDGDISEAKQQKE
jgi:hypothetical protein